MILFTMLLVPIIVALGFFVFGGQRVTFLEFVGQNVLQVGIMSAFVAMASCQNTHDLEVWNGKVASKERVRVSCSHSYPCRCRPVSCGKNCTTTHCDTCYMHLYDVDWRVHTTNQETFEISRVDLQGTTEPKRWTAVKIGEPTSLTHSYKNYVKASPNSLFRSQGLAEKYAKTLSAYPQSTYDYHRLDRLVLANGASVPDVSEWNKQLSEVNAELGHKKQVNMVVVLVKNQPPDYFYALQQSWIGGKKNDVILVVGIDDQNKIQWSEVMAWTNNKMAEIVIKDAVLKIGTIDREKIIEALTYGVENHYVRKPMKDFEYLKHAMTPTVGQWIFAMILGLISSVGLGIFMMKNDYDQDDENHDVFKTNRRRF